MRHTVFLSTILTILVFVWTGIALAEDPGARDTVKVSGGPLVIGQSIPIFLTIVNDEPLDGYSLPLILRQVTGGFARYDSAVYINRMADPRILPERILVELTDLQSPDTLHLGGLRNTLLPLPVGNTPILELYLTGLDEGVMAIDSGFRPPAGSFVLDPISPYYSSIQPEFVTQEVTVLAGTIPPTLTVPSEPPKVAAGTPVQFEISGSSPEGFPLTLLLVRFAGYDDGTRIPQNAPALGSGNPAQFSWTPTNDDIGIWSVTFAARDSAGVCTDKSVTVQVVQDNRFLLPFTIAETPDVCTATGLWHGSFDSDQAPELLVTGSGANHTATIELYDSLSDGRLQRSYNHSTSPVFGRFAPQIGYFNDDNFLDALHMNLGPEPKLVIMYGDGSNSFTLDDHNAGTWGMLSALGEFTGDNYLDVVFEDRDADSLLLFAGDSLDNYGVVSAILISDSILSLNGADFNGDGHDDLAVGTRRGVNIYLGNGAGGFVLANSYAQTFGSSEIEITNQGSDFNNDNVFDLCISTPSEGGAFSKMLEYLGQGGGAFIQQELRTVKGQILGNTVGDFNNDGALDIAFVNGTFRYVAILFGDGNGSFTNEVRYDIPFPNLQYIDALDIDLDGDLDLVVVGNRIKPSNSLFLLTNQLNPTGFAQAKLDISAHDNAKIELQSSTGLVLSDVKNTMSSAALFKRNLDQNNIIDNYAVVGAVEPTEYTLTARPRPDLPTSQPFTIKFTADNQRFRLAKDLPTASSGVKFGVYLSDKSSVSPRPGAFVKVNPPSFGWMETGQFDFQLATDLGFTNVIVNRVVTGQYLTLSAPLAVVDTAVYYWHIKPHSSPQYGSIYVFNLVAGAAPGCGDANGDGMVDISDAVSLIGYIFNGGALSNPTSADTNCDSSVDISDVVLLINYVFGGGQSPCSGC
jgi:hypothetical protein